MTLTLNKKLMDIYTTIGGNGGADYLKIRIMLGDVEKKADNGDQLAIRFSESLSIVHRFVTMCANMEFVHEDENEKR